MNSDIQFAGQVWRNLAELAEKLEPQQEEIEFNINRKPQVSKLGKELKNPLINRKSIFNERYSRSQGISGFVQAVLAGISFTSFFGLAYSSWQEVSWKNSQISELKNIVKTNETIWKTVEQNNQVDSKLRDCTKKALIHVKDLLAEQNPQAKHSAWLRTYWIGSALLGCSGWVLRSTPLKVIGLSSCVITSLFMLIKYGASSYREWLYKTKFQESVRQIQDRVIELEAIDKIRFLREEYGFDPGYKIYIQLEIEEESIKASLERAKQRICQQVQAEDIQFGPCSDDESVEIALLKKPGKIKIAVIFPSGLIEQP